MAKYEIFWARGDYRARQMDANAEGCQLYIEQHFNALPNDSQDSIRDNPALVIVGSNSSKKSRDLGLLYTSHISQMFKNRDGGLLVGPARGNWNVYYARCPSLLLEPLFCSDPTQASIIKSSQGQAKLAEAVCLIIRSHLPNGGKVAFSVGHKYRPSAPHDRGAVLVGGGTEADYAEIVLELAERMLHE